MGASLREIKSPDTLVESFGKRSSDRGSIPLASTKEAPQF